MEKIKIAVARWGNYTLAFKSLFKKLGLEVIEVNKKYSEIVSFGSKIAPEMFCFPMKVTLGYYLFAIKNGANTLFMVQNVGGSCRQRYYGAIQNKLLKDLKLKVDFFDFKATPKEIYQAVKKISGASFFKILKSFYLFFKKLLFIEKLEKLANYYRPREIEKGAVDRFLKKAFRKIEKANKVGEFKKIEKEILKKIKEIKIKKKKLPKVGLIGEIFTVCDPQVNFEIESKLARFGIEPHREMNISYHLKKFIFPFKDWIIQRKIKPYLGSTVGGHGRDAIYEMLTYIKKDFDGIVHLLPFSCMPEISVRPILEKIHQGSKIPFLSLSIDESTAEAGIDTRIEAFADVVKIYYERKKS